MFISQDPSKALMDRFRLQVSGFKFQTSAYKFQIPIKSTIQLPEYTTEPTKNR